MFFDDIVIYGFCFAPLCRLAEVGKLQPVLDKYECGQLFLHRVFGYRGVVLFPWLARVYDRDQYQLKGSESTKDETKPPTVGGGNTDVIAATTPPPATDTSSANRGKTNTFYQVLIDARDCPYIVSITHQID